MRYLINKIIDIFLVITTPASWVTIHKYNSVLDKWLIDALKDPHFIETGSEYTIKLNGITLWVGNSPYSCGYPDGFDLNIFDTGVPARSTMIRFMKSVNKFKSGLIVEKEMDSDFATFAIFSEKYFGGLKFNEVKNALQKEYPEFFV